MKLLLGSFYDPHLLTFVHVNARRPRGDHLRRQLPDAAGRNYFILQRNAKYPAPGGADFELIDGHSGRRVLCEPL